MKKAIAFGLFVIAILLGSSFVMLGATLLGETAIWGGMIIIALGTLNLAVKISFPEKPPIQLVIVKPKKRASRKPKKTVKRKTKKVTKKRKKPTKKRKR